MRKTRYLAPITLVVAAGVLIGGAAVRNVSLTRSRAHAAELRAVTDLEERYVCPASRLKEPEKSALLLPAVPPADPTPR
jgi:hypothetical protein